jgi:hypothetical protein
MTHLHQGILPHAANPKTGFHSRFAGIKKAKRTNYIANWHPVKRALPVWGGHSCPPPSTLSVPRMFEGADISDPRQSAQIRGQLLICRLQPQTPLLLDTRQPQVDNAPVFPRGYFFKR